MSGSPALVHQDAAAEGSPAARASSMRGRTRGGDDVAADHVAGGCLYGRHLAAPAAVPPSSVSLPCQSQLDRRDSDPESTLFQ